MKSFKNYIIISVALIILLVVIMSQGVEASPTLVFGNNSPSTGLNSPYANSPVGDTGSSTSGVLNSTPTPTNAPITSVPTVSVAPTKDPASVNIVNNTVRNTTTTPTKSNGNLPQTGENDIYIVSGIGLVALVIGGVAYMQSRKYDM